MNAQEAILILQRYRSGESTPAEDQLVDLWYQRLVSTGEWQWGEGEKEEFEAIIKARLLQRLDELSLAWVSDTFPEQAPVHRVHFLKRSWFRYAAAVLLLVAGAALLRVFTHRSEEVATTKDNKHLQKDIMPGTNKAILTIGHNKPIDLAASQTGITVNNTINYINGGKIADAGQLLQLTTPRGGQYQAVLPDGSRIWLNASSSIKFPSKFDGNQREVEITGEAYLEVAKNLKQPFAVNVNGAKIQVLGTSFNVNAYLDEEAVKTTLIDGSVKVLKGDEEAFLKPGQQAVARLKNIQVQTVDIDKAIAWKNGLFNFEGVSLKEAMRQLARWYNLEIVYQGSTPDIHFFGEISRNVPLSDLLNGLESAEVHFRIDGRKLIVMP